MKINGTTALITGASSGIGAATAREIARRGATVLLMARTAGALESLAGEIRATGGRAMAYPLDLTDSQAVARAAEEIRGEWGTPDILIHCAGAGRWLFVEETSPPEMEQMMAAPYFAAFYLTRALLPDMIQRRRGHIVTVGSPASLFMWPGAAAYIAARWALHGFTEALRADVYGLGIGVTLMIPGRVESEYFAHNPGSRERVPKISYLTGALTPAQVARAIVRGIEHNRRMMVVPFGLRLLSLAYRTCPRAGAWISVRTGARRTPQVAPQEDQCSYSR